MTNAVNIAQSGTISSSWRNRIINGDMRIDQRNAGAEVNPAVTGTYYLDRWLAGSTAASKFKIGQNAGAVTPPSGFTNYLGVTSLSAYTAGTNDLFNVQQRIEGFNVADLGWGTASAQTVTLSFWVRSSLTGTFGGAFRNGALDRSYLYSYTISSANTWEYKTVTIPGDTSGTWITNNGIGIYVSFSLGAGSGVSGTAGSWLGSNLSQPTGATSVVGTSGATFYITGVQLEKGSVATPFDYRDYGRELALCQRYYYKIFPNAVTKGLAIGGCSTTTLGSGMSGFFPVTMRTSPTALEQSGTASHYTLNEPGRTAVTCSAVPTYNSLTNASLYLVDGNVSSGLTGGLPVAIRTANAAAFLAWSAEL
jgi:hypothetical protein